MDKKLIKIYKDELNKQNAWVDVNQNEFKCVMDIALYHNLDHLIHDQKHQHGIWLRVKEEVLTQLLSRIQGEDEFTLLLRAKLQETGNNVFGW